MIFVCGCGHWKKAHDTSNSVKEWMCPPCKEESIRKLKLPPVRRGPMRPFSSDFKRSSFLINMMSKRVSNG